MSVGAGEDEGAPQGHHAGGDVGEDILRLADQFFWRAVEHHGHMRQHLKTAHATDLSQRVADGGDQGGLSAEAA